MVQYRNYDIQLFGTEIPESVMLEEKEIPFAMEKKDSTWTYTGKDLTTHIILPEMNCLQKHEIRVQYKIKKTGVNGLIGKMNRLSKATLYLKNHWIGISPLPYVISSTNQAWLRINYHPEAFDSIVNEFISNYRKIPEAINGTQGDNRTKNRCINYLK